MKLRRLAMAMVVLCTAALAGEVHSASAATGNILGNPSFEVPKAPAGGLARFVTGSTLGTCQLAMPGSIGYQTGCWRVFGGNVDVVNAPYWSAKGGKQSLELNGAGAGDILQVYAAQPNTTYHFSFWMSGDPVYPGTVSMLAVQEQFDSSGSYIIGGSLGSFSFDTTGHTPSSMGYKHVTTTFTTGPNTHWVDVELQSTTFNGNAPWWGPVVDKATLN